MDPVNGISDILTDAMWNGTKSIFVIPCIAQTLKIVYRTNNVRMWSIKMLFCISCVQL